MSDFRRTTEQFRVQGTQLMDKVRQIIDEGNARRIIIKNDNRTLIEFPLTVGVGGAIAAVVLAPVFAAIGAIAALVSDVEVVVERDADKDGVPEESRSYRPADLVREAADKAQATARDVAGKARAATEDVKADFQRGPSSSSTASAGGASFSGPATDKTMGSQPSSTGSHDPDASWSPTHEERGGETPPTL